MWNTQLNITISIHCKWRASTSRHTYAHPRVLAKLHIVYPYSLVPPATRLTPCKGQIFICLYFMLLLLFLLPSVFHYHSAVLSCRYGWCCSSVCSSPLYHRLQWRLVAENILRSDDFAKTAICFRWLVICDATSQASSSTSGDPLLFVMLLLLLFVV